MAIHPGRKSADVVAATKWPTTREAMWAEIRRLREFTTNDLADEVNAKLATVHTYLIGLERAGFVERIDKHRRNSKGQKLPVTWRLIKDVGVEMPRVTKQGKTVIQGQAREQMWRTMRILNEFSYRDLAIHATTEECPVNEVDAKHYLGYLAKARYVVMTERGGRGKPTRYRFLKSRYTGPKPPMIQRVRQVFDPNINQIMWPRRDEE